MVNQFLEAKVKLIAFFVALTWGSIGVDQKVRIDATEFVLFSIGYVDFRITTVVSLMAGLGTLLTIIWTGIRIVQSLKTNRDKDNDPGKDRENL